MTTQKSLITGINGLILGDAKMNNIFGKCKKNAVFGCQSQKMKKYR